MNQPQRETMKLWDGEMSYLEWGNVGPSLLFSHANAKGSDVPLYPGSATAGTVAFVIAAIGGIAIIAATAYFHSKRMAR